MTGPASKAAVALALLAVPWAARAQQETLQARATVASRDVYVGQQFLLKIQVEGTDQPDLIDIGPLEADFTVAEAGGGATSSTSVSIVNGRMSRQVRRGYNFNYRLAANKPGEVFIPPLTVRADSRTVRTQPIPLRVRAPEENADFKLRLSLSAERAYVGQPLELATAWYIGGEVQDFSFTFPLLEDRRFEVLDRDPDQTVSAGGNAGTMEIALGDRRASAQRGRGELDGRQYPVVLRFRKLLVPRAAGSIRLPAATVTFSALGKAQGRRRSLFDDFFGGSVFSGAFGRRPVLQTLAIPSNRPRLEVRELPSAGRPAGFSGWIGRFRIAAEAAPTSVAVGEPITLSLRVEGADLLPTAQLPPLGEQPDLARDFRIPREIAAGETRGGALRFTQTLRAKHARVERIPPVELHYFDPEAEAYRAARTESIPLAVEAARIVTAEDAEGRGEAGPRQLAVQSSEQGIAHNYVDASALRPAPGAWSRWVGPLGPAPVAWGLLGLPPLLALGVLAVRLGRERGAVPWRRKRVAHARWRKQVGAVDVEGAPRAEASAAVLAALRAYLARRLGAADSGQGVWTYADAASRLRSRNAGRNGGDASREQELLAVLEEVFKRCEAASYAGGGGLDPAWNRQLVADAKVAVDGIEEYLA